MQAKDVNCMRKHNPNIPWRQSSSDKHGVHQRP